MGYSTRAEYTIELIRNPESYNHIGRNYFATGFILASGIDENTLKTIMLRWNDIDMVTSNRIRFLFFIDNETVLNGYPNKPYFTESGYKRHHSTLLEIARKQGFNLSVKAGTQLANNPFKSETPSWHPQERVRKLAQQLGITQLLPCLVWARHDNIHCIYVHQIEEFSPDEIFNLIRQFSDTFYDQNVDILEKIDNEELSLEKYFASLDISLKDIKSIPEMLERERDINKLLNSLKSVSFYEKTWIAQIDHLIDIGHITTSLTSSIMYKDLVSFMKTASSWARTCKTVESVLSGNNDTRIPITRLSDALVKCFSIEEEIPSQAARLTPPPNIFPSSEIFTSFLKLVSLDIIHIDNSDSKRSLNKRIERFINYLNSYISEYNIDKPLGISLNDITIIANLASILREIKETQLNIPNDLIDLSNYINNSIREAFYNTTLAHAITIKIWIYYSLIEVRKSISEQIYNIIGHTDKLQQLYNNPDFWNENINKPLSNISDLSKNIQWPNLLSYQRHYLAKLSDKSFIEERNNIDIENKANSLRKEINKKLTPISIAVSGIENFDNEISISEYIIEIQNVLLETLNNKSPIHNKSPLFSNDINNHNKIYDNSIQGRSDGMLSILFLAADPTNASRLRLGEELREIQEKLQLSKLRENFKLEQRLSVRPTDISQALLDIQPRIVHFSGHGTSEGALCFENQLGEIHVVTPHALSALFEQFNDQVTCILLNACYSKTQAEALSEYIDYVIGMNKAIGDRAAIAFSIGFYQAVGAGRSIEDAFKLGCVQLRLQNIPEHLTPILAKRNKT